MKRRGFLILGATAVLGLSLPALGERTGLVSPAAAAKAEVYDGIIQGVGAGGYDVVSYFTMGKPVEGQAEFTHSYNGVDWRFSSAENRDLFAANPARYAPQYGGYCAWAIAQGDLAKGDPKYWKVVDGKLYLNFNNRIQRRWEADIPGFIAGADANWPAVLN